MKPPHEIASSLSWACLLTSLSLTFSSREAENNMKSTVIFKWDWIHIRHSKNARFALFVIIIYDTNASFWDKKKKINIYYLCHPSTVLKIVQISSYVNLILWVKWYQLPLLSKEPILNEMNQDHIINKQLGRIQTQLSSILSLCRRRPLKLKGKKK